MARQMNVLTDDQIQFFLDNGYIKIPQAFSPEQAREWTKDVWKRMGMDPEDKTTWTREWTNMPHHHKTNVMDFAPKAWEAICDLVGGEERINPAYKTWNDGFIVNLGREDFDPAEPTPRKALQRWHCDGDSFLHFLDSPEQGLLVVPLFTDIVPNGGGTMIAPQAIGACAKYLADHPEGVMPTGFPFRAIADNCNEFVELTGKAGDVVLLHPLMLHSASNNQLRVPRIITNPPISLISPFVFSRTDPEEYSVVEKKTMKELGVDLDNIGMGYQFNLAAERKALVPERIARQQKWKEEELERLKKQGTTNGLSKAVAA